MGKGRGGKGGEGGGEGSPHFLLTTLTTVPKSHKSHKNVNDDILRIDINHSEKCHSISCYNIEITGAVQGWQSPSSEQRQLPIRPPLISL